jgi:hypothetical protein
MYSSVVGLFYHRVMFNRTGEVAESPVMLPPALRIGGTFHENFHTVGVVFGVNRASALPKVRDDDDARTD